MRKINWRRAVEIADANPGQTYFIGIADQSVRTHFRKGRYANIDPRPYEVWTEREHGTQARIYLRRKP